MALVGKRVQAWTGSSILDVAFDVCVVVIDIAWWLRIVLIASSE